MALSVKVNIKLTLLSVMIFMMSVLLLVLLLYQSDLDLNINIPLFSATNNSQSVAGLSRKEQYIGMVITSCGRLDELEITINSFEEYNTYKYIKPKIVIDDCLDNISAFNHMSSSFTDYTFILSSTPKTKQYSDGGHRIILSLKEATFKYIVNNPKYADLNLKYIFYSEDDWRYYSHGFIEDSLAILNSDYNHSQISYVHLRNVQLLKPFMSTYDFCGGWKRFRLRKDVNGMPKMYTSNVLGYNGTKVNYYMHDPYGIVERPCWSNFDFNPGLKSVEDLRLILENTECTGEYCIACKFKENNKLMAVTAYNGYVGHLGHKNRHVRQVFHNQKRRIIAINDTQVTVINERIGIDLRNCMYVSLQ